MKKKILSVCLSLTLLLSFQSVHAASTCNYQEQVELSNIASTIKSNYEIQRVIRNNQDEIVSDVDIETAMEQNSDYYIDYVLNVHVLNLTEDVYVNISSSVGMNQTYYYQDTSNGEISFDGGKLNEIITYKITVFSNKLTCPGESLRTIEFVTPMRNIRAYSNDCSSIPDFEYCKEYITAPFLASDIEIEQSIASAYERYQKNLQTEEEEKNKSFFEKLEDFLKENKMIIGSVIGIVIILGALTIIVVINKRRSRVL